MTRLSLARREELKPLSEAETAEILAMIDGDKIILHVAGPPQTKPWDDTPLEYAVVSIKPERNCPQHIIVLGKYEGQGWIANPSLRGLVNVLLADITAVERERAWQPIETAPKDGQWVIICWNDGIAGYQVESAWWSEHRKKWIGAYADFAEPPTHWMRLPSPPSDFCTRP